MKKIILSLMILLVFGFLGYEYIMTSGERNLDSEKTEFILTSKAILSEYSLNIELSNKKYLEKAVAISGVVTSVKNHEVIIDNIVICNFTTIDKNIKIDQNVSIKGRVVGFDDLMGELQMDKCILNTN